MGVWVVLVPQLLRRRVERSLQLNAAGLSWSVHCSSGCWPYSSFQLCQAAVVKCTREHEMLDLLQKAAAQRLHHW
jgi:hypothetical protein